MLASLQKFYGKMWVDFWFSTETQYFTDISNNDQWKEHDIVNKAVSGFLKKLFL